MRCLLADSIFSNDCNDLLIHTLCISTQSGNDSGSNTAAVLQNGNQDMFGSDQTCTGAEGFLHRIFHHALRRWSVPALLAQKNGMIGRNKFGNHIQYFLVVNAVCL